MLSLEKRLPAKYKCVKNTSEYRVHRRSIEQKINRAKITDRLRKLHNIPPELQDDSNNQAHFKPKIQDSKLQRWMEERKVKNMVQKKLAKPRFRICKVEQPQPVFLFSERYINDDGKADIKVTRSMTKLSELAKGIPNSKAQKFNEDLALRKGPSKLTSNGILAKRCAERPSKIPVLKRTKPGSSLSSKVEALNGNKRHSFAPSHFAFTVPVGVKSYAINNGDIGMNGSAETIMSSKTRMDKNSINFGDIFEPGEVNKIGKKLNDASSKTSNPTKEVWPTDCSDAQQTAVDNGAQKNIGVSLSPYYFRHLLTSQSELLRSLCEDWRPYLKNSEISNENAIGAIRTTIGQTELLMAERFQQFSSLIDDYEFERGEKPTTCFDLQGFWDMVCFQVEDVTKKFNELKKMKEKNFIGLSSPVKTPAVRKIARKKSANTVNDEKRKAEDVRSQAAHQRIAEAKAKLALKRQCVDKAYIPGTVEEQEDTNGLKRCVRESIGKKTSIPVRSSEVLLPLPFLENLNISSPTKANTMRLSELYSPLRNRITAGQLDRTSSLIGCGTPTNLKTVTSNVSFTSNRVSNLIRLSDICKPMQPKPLLEKENDGLSLLDF